MGSVRTSHPGGRGPCSSASCGGVVGADMCCDRRSEDINCTCSCACLDQSYRKQRPSPRRRLAGEERCRHRNVEVRGKGKGCRPHLMGPMYSTASAAAAYTAVIWRHCPQTRNNHSLGSQLLSLTASPNTSQIQKPSACLYQRQHMFTVKLCIYDASFFENPKLFRSASAYYVSFTLLFRPSRGNNSSRAPVT